MPHDNKPSLTALSLGASGADSLPDPRFAPEFDLRFTMPPAELRERVASLIAQGLYKARLPWLPGEKIVAGDLEGVAMFVIGGLMGLEKAQHDGKKN